MFILWAVLGQLMNRPLKPLIWLTQPMGYTFVDRVFQKGESSHKLAWHLTCLDLTQTYKDLFILGIFFKIKILIGFLLKWKILIYKDIILLYK